jgi:hypothetical protein
MKRGFMGWLRIRRKRLLEGNIIEVTTLTSLYSWRAERLTTGVLAGVNEIMGAGPTPPLPDDEQLTAPDKVSRARASLRKVRRSRVPD